MSTINLRWVLGQRQSNAALSPDPSLKKGPEINGPPGAAAISCRALARWPKSQFGGLGGSFKPPPRKTREPLKRGGSLNRPVREEGVVVKSGKKRTNQLLLPRSDGLPDFEFSHSSTYGKFP